MIFTEFRFLFFFALVFAIRWMLCGRASQKLWLLLCSYVFYAAWDWRFLSLIWISTIVDYLVGLRLGSTADPAARKRWITLSVVTNLTILGVFKYCNFFAGSLVSLLAWLGLPVSYNVLHIVLPVGISLLYAAQIYCDFSGYSEMAIACARMLGFSLGDNFDFPYLATSIKDFWRRWHISLSSWLKDYLYISLGGNRGSQLFTLRNLMLTMLLGGLWHGASWNFVIWGGLHGIALIAHRLWAPVGDRLPRFLGDALGWALTFWWVNLAWIFFRAADLGEALSVARSFVFFADNGPMELGHGLLWLLAVLAVLHLAGHASHRSGWWRRVPGWAFAIGYGVLVALALSLVHPAAQPFIYFQF